MNDFNWDMDLSDFDETKLADKYDDGWKTVTINSVSIEPNKKHSGSINYFLLISNEIWKEKKICIWIAQQYKHMAVDKFSSILSNGLKKDKKQVENMFKTKELELNKLEPLLTGISFKVWCEKQPGSDGKMWLTLTDSYLSFGEKEYTPKKKAPKQAKNYTEDVPF